MLHGHTNETTARIPHFVITVQQGCSRELSRVGGERFWKFGGYNLTRGSGGSGLYICIAV